MLSALPGAITLTALCLFTGYRCPAQQLDTPFGTYVYQDENITLQLAAPDRYTLFEMEQDSRSGAVSSRELSRGTFDIKNGNLLLQEYPTRHEMTLEIETPMILRARKVKGVDEGQPFYAWRKENQEGRTLVEGSWKKGRRHGTWIYYDSAGNVLRSERYRRGKLKNK